MNKWKRELNPRRSILNLTFKEKNIYNKLNSNPKINTSPNRKKSDILSNKIKLIDKSKFLERKKEFNLNLKKKLERKVKSSKNLNEKIVESETYNKLYDYINREKNMISNEIKIAKKYIKIKPGTFFYRNYFKHKNNKTFDKTKIILNQPLPQSTENNSNNNCNKSLLDINNSNNNNQNKSSSLFKYQQFNKNNTVNNTNLINSLTTNSITNNTKSNFLSQISNNKKVDKLPNKNILLTSLKNNFVKNNAFDLTFDNNNNNTNDSNIIEMTTEGEINSNRNCRIKNLIINYEPNWYKNNGIFQMKLDKKVFEYRDIQKSFISEEILLIVEDMNNYLLEFNSEKNFSNYLKKSNNNFQRIVNINIEQCIALMLEISYILIGEYKGKLNLFMSNIIPLPKKRRKKLVSIDNEFKEFTCNSTLLNKVYNFFLKCYDAYSFITSKDKNSLPISKFTLLHQYLDRLRFALTIMKQDAENLCKEYQDNPDKKILNDFLEKLECMNNQKNEKVIDKKEKYHSGVDIFKYKGPKFNNKEKEMQKIWRINKVLGKFDTKDSRVKRNVLNLNNNKHINFLLKYANEEFRNAIISERMREKNLKNQKDEETDIPHL